MSKITVSSGLLHKRLSSISGVITNSPIMPIAECFLIDVTPNKLIATASDLHVTMVTHVNVETNDSFSVCVPAKLLLETIKNISEQPIVIELKFDGYCIEIQTSNGVYKISCENPQDYPKTKYIGSGIEPIKIDSEQLSTAIQNTLYAVSSDDLRPAMGGISINISPDNTVLYATDGHRLVKYVTNDVVSPVSYSAIVPKKAAILLKGIIYKQGEINVKISDYNIEFKTSDILISARIIDERFPDVEQAIPVGNDKSATINKDDILGALKRSLIYANKATNQVRLNFNNDSLIISSEDLDYSIDAKETIECQYKGDDITIGFNVKFLIEAINNINSDTVIIEMSQPNRAGIIKPVYDYDVSDEVLALIMPVMLNTY